MIKHLANEGIVMNITLIFTEEQIKQTVDSLNPDVDSIISVFAGRMADAGVDPIPYMLEAKYLLNKNSKAKLLWASTRETRNIFQAENCGCDIITVPISVLNKLSLVGKDLLEYSQEGAQVFAKDAQSSGLSVLPATV